MEHIKTATQIAIEIDDLPLLELCNKKWVSLSWLKEQIQSEMDLIKSCGEDGSAEHKRLIWILSMLEE
jgi:hypothetical protein